MLCSLAVVVVAARPGGCFAPDVVVVVLCLEDALPLMPWSWSLFRTLGRGDALLPLPLVLP